MIEPFDKPIYFTRPLLPDLTAVTEQLRDVWQSGFLTNNGQKHRELERRLREYLGAPTLSLFVNGMLALSAAVYALKLRGEVITTPFTFPATPNALALAGITPVFADIDPDNLTLDPERIEKLINPSTTAILAVHVFGSLCDVEAVSAIAKRHGLRVIYDAAHAFGARLNGQPIASFGDATMFSFHATKLFHTGEGGALAMTNPDQKISVDYWKNFGIKSEEEVVMVGTNGKMSELQASLGLAVLPLVEGERSRRKKIRSIYREELGEVPGIRFIPDQPNVVHSHQYFVIRIVAKKFGRTRDEVQQSLQHYNVFPRKYFFPLCSNTAPFRHHYSSHPGRLPIANHAVTETLALPYFGALTDEDVRRICSMLRSFARP